MILYLRDQKTGEFIPVPALIGPPGPPGPAGKTGERGETGRGLEIRGTFASVSALEAAVTNPEQGAMYNVGTAAPYNIYMYDTALGWVDQGQLQGAKGDPGYTPQKGVDYFDGEDGEDGNDGISVVSVEQTSTSSADGGSNVITVTLSNGKKSTFTVKNGSKGSKGDDGYTPIKGTDYFTDAEAQEIAAQAAGLVEVPEGFSGKYGDLTGVPSSFPPDAHTHAAGNITGGVFGGMVQAKPGAQDPNTFLLRNSVIVNSDQTSPTSNGQIVWVSE